MGITSATKSVATSRMSTWVWISIPLLLVVAILSPQKIGLVVYKINLITIAAALAYWIDRTAFPYARPDQVAEALMPSAMIRRSIIMAAVVWPWHLACNALGCRLPRRLGASVCWHRLGGGDTR